jgi:2-polyprenyl-3-methyl-5-hydroxy-6-metoxy-1,4-benzoquinol methylase
MTGRNHKLISRVERLIGWRILLRYGDPLVMDRWRWLRPRLVPGNIRTFDAGCGNGCFSFAAASLGNQVIAGSFDEESITKANARAELFGIKNVTFVEIDLRDLKAASGDLPRFDQIICTECIEHIVDDGGLIRDLASLLVPGGRLLLTTPAANHRGLRHERLSETEDGGHVRWGYTEDRLKELCVTNGLQVVETTFTSGLLSQKITNLMRVPRERAAWALTYPLRIVQLLDRPFNRLIGYPWFGIGIVAIKKDSSTGNE